MLESLCAYSGQAMLLRLFADENLSGRYVSRDVYPYWSDGLASLLICESSSSYAEGREVDAPHVWSDIVVSLLSTPRVLDEGNDRTGSNSSRIDFSGDYSIFSRSSVIIPEV